MGYKVDLKQYMAECDGNYLRLMQLFPAIEVESQRRLAAGSMQLVMRVQDRMKYTTDLIIALEGNEPAASWLKKAVMKVRLYHDLQSAEVHEFGGGKIPAPKNNYPNKEMYHQDEKLQWNRLLREWLAHIKTHGYLADPVAVK